MASNDPGESCENTSSEKTTRRRSRYGKIKSEDQATDLFTGPLPPHSVAAEQAALGCVLLDQGMFDQLCELLPAGEKSFYDLRHQEIWKAFQWLRDARVRIDLITAGQRLKDTRKLDEIGSYGYLNQIADTAISTSNVSYYANIVYEKYLTRRMAQVCVEAMESVYKEEGAIEDKLDAFEKGALGVRGELLDASRNGTANIDTIMGEVDDAISNAILLKGQPLGIPTKFGDLDNLIGGLIAPDIFFLAARPSVGKTGLSLNIAENIAIHSKPGLPVGFFSLEMSAKQLLLRMACSLGKVNARGLLRGSIEQPEVDRLDYAKEKIRAAKDRLFIDERGGLSVNQIAARARRMVSLNGVKVIMIDYLQLIHSHRKHNTRNDEVAYISHTLKALAKELSVPIILISQLNRGAVNNPGGPRMSDLRDSGACEEDADIIGLMDFDESRKDEETFECQPVKLIIAKHRNGPTGLVRLNFFKPYVRFEVASKISDKDIPEKNRAKSEPPEQDDEPFREEREFNYTDV